MESSLVICNELMQRASHGLELFSRKPFRQYTCLSQLLKHLFGSIGVIRVNAPFVQPTLLYFQLVHDDPVKAL
jgi:hypothetical protein